MSYSRTAKKIVRTVRKKTEAFLGDEGIDALKSLKDDVVNASDQVVQVAREVREDCGENALGNAKKFYADAFDAARNSAEKAKEHAKANRKERERVRQKLKKERDSMIRRATPLLACMILFAVAVIVVLFRLSH